MILNTIVATGGSTPITNLSISASSAIVSARSTAALIDDKSPPTIVTYFPGHTEPDCKSVIPALFNISSVIFVISIIF